MIIRAIARPFRDSPSYLGDDGSYRPVSFWQETVPTSGTLTLRSQL